MYDGGQLFRPFSLCIFQNLSCLYDGGQLFRPFFTFVLLLLPGSKPTFVVLTQVTSKIAYYDGQFLRWRPSLSGVALWFP